GKAITGSIAGLRGDRRHRWAHGQTILEYRLALGVLHLVTRDLQHDRAQLDSRDAADYGNLHRFLRRGWNPDPRGQDEARKPRVAKKGAGKLGFQFARRLAASSPLLTEPYARDDQRDQKHAEGEADEAADGGVNRSRHMSR